MYVCVAISAIPSSDYFPINQSVIDEIRPMEQSIWIQNTRLVACKYVQSCMVEVMCVRSWI